MKITMYELLGMVKDGKAPKKIMFLGNTYRYDEIDKTYRNIIGNTNIGEMHNLEFYLDDEVEIIEEEKEIPDEININLAYIDKEYLLDKEDVDRKINEIINRHNILVDKVSDYLKSKGDE